MTTRTKEEAIDLLKQKRAELLTKARTFAMQYARDKGAPICALEVRIEMEKRGMLTAEEQGFDGRWIGVLFTDKDVWERTDDTVNLGYPQRNVHKGPRRLWALKRAVAGLPSTPAIRPTKPRARRATGTDQQRFDF